MMRVYFCPSCKRWRMVSNRLKAECLDCDGSLLLSDIPFEQWVKLEYPARDEVTAAFLGQIGDDYSDKNRQMTANIFDRETMEGILGEPVSSNLPKNEDTGYDY